MAPTERRADEFTEPDDHVCSEPVGEDGEVICQEPVGAERVRGGGEFPDRDTTPTEPT